MTRLFRHFRSNVVAYVALFVALGGTSYAAVQLPVGSVGNRQIRNHSITPIKFDLSTITGSVRYWAVVNGAGRVLASSKPKPKTYGFGGSSPGTGTIDFGKPTQTNCYPFATVNDFASGFASVFAVGTAIDLQTYDPNGQLAPKTVDLEILCAGR
jgi:hypothetical protein